jgi:hypothetical protein
MGYELGGPAGWRGLAVGALTVVALAGCGAGGPGTSAIKLGVPAAGRYSGKTSQGRPIVLIVSPGGRSLSYLGVEADWRCSTGQTGSDTVPHSPAGVVPLKNGAFKGSFSVPRSSFKPVYHLLGSYTNGSFAGTIQVTATPQNGAGTCSSGTISWTASPPLTGSTGTSTGGTSTG